MIGAVPIIGDPIRSRAMPDASSWKRAETEYTRRLTEGGFALTADPAPGARRTASAEATFVCSYGTSLEIGTTESVEGAYRYIH